jgi:hypothetical protein
MIEVMIAAVIIIVNPTAWAATTPGKTGASVLPVFCAEFRRNLLEIAVASRNHFRNTAAASG